MYQMSDRLMSLIEKKESSAQQSGGYQPSERLRSLMDKKKSAASADTTGGITGIGAIAGSVIGTQAAGASKAQTSAPAESQERGYQPSERLQTLMDRREGTTIEAGGYQESDRLKVLRGGTVGVDGDYIDKYLADSQKYLQDSQAELDALDYASATAKGWESTQQTTSQDLAWRATNIRNFLTQNQANMEPEYYTLLMKQLDEIDNANKGVKGYYDEAYDYYSKWDTQEAYDTDVRKYGYYQKYGDMNYNQITDVLMTMDREGNVSPEEREWLEQYQLSIMTDADFDTRINQLKTQLLTLDTVQKEYNALTRKLQTLGPSTPDWQEASRQQAQIYQQYGDLDQKIAQTKQELEDTENLREIVRLEGYNDPESEHYDPQFEEKSRYVSQPTGKERSFLDTILGIYDDKDSGWEDPLYEYINGNESAGIWLSNASTEGHMPGLTSIYARSANGKEEAQQMTEDEVKTFNYLYHTQGKKAAHAYYELLEGNLNYRQRKAEEAKWASYADEHPVLASAYSVLSSPAKLLTYTGQIADYIGDGKIDQNAGYNRFSYANTAILNQVSQNIQNSGKWGKVGSFAYNTGMSMANFLFTSGISGGSGTIAMTIMGSGAAADTVIEAKDRGLSDGQSFALGTIAGLTEAATERYSLETLLNPKLLADGRVKYILKNMLAEGSEEMTSELVNTISDILIAKDKSQWQMAINAYMEKGLSESEAFARALADQAISMGLSGLGGAISGGFMSGGNVVIQNIRTNNLGKQLQEMNLGGEEINAMIESGLESDIGTESYKIAQELREKLAQGKTLTKNDLGRLQQANMEAIAAEQAKAPEDNSQVAGTQQDINTSASRLSAVLGKEISFYSSVNSRENGYYKDGVIYVNQNGADPLAQVISHELTHSIEMTDAYSELSKMVMNRIQQQGDDLEQLRRRKAEDYNRNGIQLSNRAAIDKEIVAEYISKNLLTDEQSILEMVRENRNLGQRIFAWLKSLIQKIKGTNSPELEFLNRAKSLYAKALQQSTKAASSFGDKSEGITGKTASENAGLSDLEETRQWVREQYKTGNMTDEEYDTWMNYLEQQEEMDFGGEQEKQYSFAGENAKSADIEALSKAKELDTQNVSNETIRQLTGWFKGSDGKWRFEIDDSKMQYDRTGDMKGAASKKQAQADMRDAWESLSDMADDETLNKVRAYNRADIAKNYEAKQELYDELIAGPYASFFKQYTDSVDYARTTMGAGAGGMLEDYIEHPALFEAYPELRRVKLRFDDLKGGTQGYFDRNNNEIVLNQNATLEHESVLIHEIQHAIQKVEGFARGASTEYWQQVQDSDSAIKTNDRKIAEAKERMERILEDLPENIAEQFRQYEQLVREGNEAKATEIAQRLSNGMHGDLFMDFFMELMSVEQWEKYNYKRGVNDLYRNTAGEIEAFDSQRRAPMDEKGRKNTPPDLGGDGVVFAEKTDWNLQAIGKTTDNRPFVKIDRDILANVPKNDWVKTVTKNLMTRFPNGLSLRSGQVLVDGQSRKEMTYSKYTRWLMNKHPALYADKLRATDNVDEIVQAATDWVNEGLNHPRKDSIAQFARGKVLIRIGNNDYSADVVVGTRRNGKMVMYDLLKITPTRFVEKETDTAITANPSPEADRSTVSISRENISRDESGVKEQIYSADGDSDLKGLELPSLEETSSAPNGRQYSIGETENADTEAEAIRSTLPAKARDYLKGTERKLLDRLCKNLSVPAFARKNYLEDIVRQVSDTYLRTGTVDQETMGLLFDKAYAEGIVADAEYYDQYKEVKDFLRTQAVTISKVDRSDIPDFNDFRKRAFGSLKIVNEGGLPADSAYVELREMAPELFPESITHPADQMQRMYEVAQSIRISEKSLNDYYGSEAEEFRKWARNDFEEAITDVFHDLRAVKRYSDERNSSDVDTAPTTPEEAMEAYVQLKEARRKYERVSLKNLLTDSDQIKLGQLLRGEITTEALDSSKDNVKGILAAYEAKQEYERLVKQIAKYKSHLRGQLREEADGYLETAINWKDKKAGIMYSRETMRRNIYDIVPDRNLAESICRNYFDTVRSAEAQSTKFKTEMRNRVQGLKLSRKVAKGNLVSESHAVQLLGEAQDNIRMLEKSKGRMKVRDGKTLAEWHAVIRELWNSSPMLDKAKVENAVKEFRSIYDELFQKMNEVRVENGYEPVNYRNGYFPHFQPGESDSILKNFGRAMGIETEVVALPTTINGLTHNFKPGIQWFGHAQERLGFNTTYDSVEGFDKYIEGVSSVIHHTRNIQKLRAFAAQMRYQTSDEGIKKQVDKILQRGDLTEDEKQALVLEVYKNGKYTLSNFVTEVEEYTNLLANKKSKLDRTVESLMGRRIYTFMKNLENRVGANMIAGNFTSAFTNWIPLTQAGAQLNSRAMLKGMWATLHSYVKDDGISGLSDFLTNRAGSDTLVKRWTQKTSEILGKPMEWIDSFTSGSIVRAAYYNNLKKGMSEAEAMAQADIFAASVMADRSKGAMPTLFESKNPLYKAFTQFQLEVNNQFSEVFKDLPRVLRDRGLAVFVALLLKYFLGAFLYNEVYEYFIGRRPALDPLGIINDTVGDLSGYELPNLVELGKGIASGDMPSFETEKLSFGESGKNLAVNMLEELPFSSGLTLLGFELDGGRIPVSSAIPDLTALWDAATNENWSAEKRWKEAQDELNKLAYVLPPFGGNQISKIWKGIKAYNEGGSYSVNSEGKDILQYPVFKDGDIGDFTTLLQTTIFGKSSLNEAREWVDSGFNSFNEKQTAMYQDLMEVGVDDRDAYKLIRGLEGLDSDEKRLAIKDADISNEGKAIAYYGSVASESECALMDALSEAGAAEGETYKLVDALKAASSLKELELKEAQYEAISAAGLTEEEKLIVVEDLIGTEILSDAGTITQYGWFRAAWSEGVEIDEYMEMRAKGVDTKKYLEFMDAGVDKEDAMELAIKLQMIDGEDLPARTEKLKQWRAITQITSDTDQQLFAFESVMSPSEYRNLSLANSFAIIPGIYVSFMEKLPDYDKNGNGEYTQAELQAAIDGTAGRLKLTQRQKAALWQLLSTSTSTKNNPYDKVVGQQILDAKAAEKAKEEGESLTFEEEVMRQILANWSK